MSFRVLTFQQTPPVPFVDPRAHFELDEYKLFLADFMGYVSYRADALGLAANQIAINGDPDKCQKTRVFAMRAGPDSPWEVIVAPKTEESIGHPHQVLEGCLSWPGMKILAQRYKQVRVTYRNIRGELVENRLLDGMLAQVWQHEINHLDGVPENVVAPGATVKRTAKKVGRNEPCPCGSGLKFKRCCGK